MPTRQQSIATLRRKADKLYQQVLIKQKPKSVVSGQPTEVIHHFVPKSQSSNLRYNWDNGVPLTNSEHFKHHTVGDPQIMIKVIEHYGDDWYKDLNSKRHVIKKMNKGYLKEVIASLETFL